MHYFDLWHHFCLDRTLYAVDGLHLNGVGKARLGRVIGECLAEIPRPPKTGSGSIDVEDIEDTDSVASDMDDACIASTSHAAPDSHAQMAVSIERQEDQDIELASVSVPEEGKTHEEDFH